jgi:hypothetical protein
MGMGQPQQWQRVVQQRHAMLLLLLLACMLRYAGQQRLRT